MKIYIINYIVKSVLQVKFAGNISEIFKNLFFYWKKLILKFFPRKTSELYWNFFLNNRRKKKESDLRLILRSRQNLATLPVIRSAHIGIPAVTESSLW